VLGRPSADQTKYFPAGATLGRKKNKRKKQNSKTLKPQPEQSLSMTYYTEKKRGIPHSQMPAPNLLRRCRQMGLAAEGVTPELLRLKF
jgi:hypothetical protein